jgi:hypothetical protein
MLFHALLTYWGWGGSLRIAPNFFSIRTAQETVNALDPVQGFIAIFF